MKFSKILFLASVVFFFGQSVNAQCSGSYTHAKKTSNTETAAITDSRAANSYGDSPNIVSLAASTDILSTLVAAVKAGDLVDVLQGDGPFTVFAPTNVAFAALPQGTLDFLLKPENKGELVKILTYHVVPGKVASTDLSDGMSAATVQGSKVEVSINKQGVKINDATVVKADIEASNGIVHVIDKVILPPKK